MKLLLDTHVWLRLMTDSGKLSSQVRRQIDNAKNELYLSPVSIWEAYHLIRRKRVHMKNFEERLADMFASVQFLEAPLNFEVAAAAGRIELPQSDVGDVFLAATASVFDMTLVTSDEQLLACRWLKTLANE